MDTILTFSYFLWGYNYGSTEIRREREEWVYPFVSFVAEFGGSLGLFIGFSFFTLLAAAVALLAKPPTPALDAAAGAAPPAAPPPSPLLPALLSSLVCASVSGPDVSVAAQLIRPAATCCHFRPTDPARLARAWQHRILLGRIWRPHRDRLVAVTSKEMSAWNRQPRTLGLRL